MKRRVWRRVRGIVGYALIGLIAAGLTFVFFSNAQGNVTFVGGYTTLWVMTPSMKPTIPERSYILVEQAVAADVQEGDVLVFRSDDPVLQGACNTHRVMEILGDHEEFVTKGDGNPGPDRYTAKAADVVGIYRKNLPVLSLFGRFLSSGIGIVIAAAAIFVVFMLIYLPDMIHFRRDKSEDIQKAHQDRINELVQAEVARLQAENAVPSPTDDDQELPPRDA